MKKIRIGTRGSNLALMQAREIQARLEAAHPGLECECVVVKTKGDERSLGVGDEAQDPSSPAWKGMFVKELEEALLAGTIDLAVHSVKDMETSLPEGLKLAAVPIREDPRDALISRHGHRWDELGPQVRIGASSLRRQAQLKRLRRDIHLVDIRGNVDSRLKKLHNGEVDALVLAVAGLKRLNRVAEITEYFSIDRMMPAPGQGAIGIEIRSDRPEIEELVKAVNDPNAYLAVEAERAFLRTLGGSCRIPVGALAVVDNGWLSIEGIVLSPDGLKAVRKKLTGHSRFAQRLGSELASHLRAYGADRLLFGNWRKG